MMAMTITADSLLPRLKLDYDGGYDVTVKGLSVLVLVFKLPHQVSSPFKIVKLVFDIFSSVG
jgi:hypothetical protein